MSIVLDGVSFRYAGAPREALDGVSLACADGITLVTGPLGSGCTTLLLVIAGLAPHATGGTRTGRVAVLGHDPAAPQARPVIAGRVGILFPTPWTQLSGMAYTVRDEVAFGPANLGWERARIAAAVARALETVEAVHLGTRDPRTLSGGELQRVMLAAVLAMEPDVLLLDEPALELDPEGAERFYALLPHLARRATLVIATTDLDRAAETAGRVVLLDRGRIVADDAPPQVLGDARAAALGVATTVTRLARAAGCPPPYPLTVDAAVSRYGG